MSFPSPRHFKAVSKLLPLAHIEKAVSSFKAWQYCSKEDSRLEGPVHFGEMPKPEKVKNVTYAEYNNSVLTNLEAMIEDGRVNIKDYVKLKQA